MAFEQKSGSEKEEHPNDEVVEGKEEGSQAEWQCWIIKLVLRLSRREDRDTMPGLPYNSYYVTRIVLGREGQRSCSEGVSTDE